MSRRYSINSSNSFRKSEQSRYSDEPPNVYYRRVPASNVSFLTKLKWFFYFALLASQAVLLLVFMDKNRLGYCRKKARCALLAKTLYGDLHPTLQTVIISLAALGLVFEIGWLMTATYKLIAGLFMLTMLAGAAFVGYQIYYHYDKVLFLWKLLTKSDLKQLIPQEYTQEF